jgi:predicted phosphodiesterase
MSLLARRLFAYQEFSKHFPIRRRLSENKLWFVDTVPGQGGATAAIAGLTSSWASGEDHEDEHRYLAVGEFQTKSAMDALRKIDADIRFVLMHHPLEALLPEDERALSRDLRGTCDVLLRGHLHKTKLNVTADPDWGFATLAAGSAYETKWTKNGYLLGRATMTTSRIELKVKARRWAGDGDFFGADTTTYRQGRNDGILELGFPRLTLK